MWMCVGKNTRGWMDWGGRVRQAGCAGRHAPPWDLKSRDAEARAATASPMASEPACRPRPTAEAGRDMVMDSAVPQ